MPKPCAQSECTNETTKRVKGFCPPHYEKQRRSGGIGSRACSAGDCDNWVMGRGLCSGHYWQWTKGKELTPLRRAGEWGSWETTSKGYIRRRKTLPDGRREVQWQHQMVMEEHIGRPLEKGEEVHHKNGVRDDNRISNLELWSTSQPKGQRWQDKLEHAHEMIRLYGGFPDTL